MFVRPAKPDEPPRTTDGSKGTLWLPPACDSQQLMEARRPLPRPVQVRGQCVCQL